MKNLPLFPTPYPGESLYSILCRYHIRSCNKTDASSIATLFGSKTSLRYTVLSPALLSRETGWLKTLSGISMGSLIYENTAVRLTLPFQYAYSMGILSEPKNNTPEFQSFFRSVQRRFAHPSKQLRYCPKCAAQQRALFGEAYWQILPNVAGYEICHIHGEPIRDSGIPLASIMYKFCPASHVIRKIKAEEDTDHLRKTDLFHDSYEQHAIEINRCYLQGDKMENYADHLCAYVRKNLPNGVLNYREFLNDKMVQYPESYSCFFDKPLVKGTTPALLINTLSHIQMIRMFELLGGMTSSLQVS